ncbi:hypothetical protein PVAND_004403 [Polypedilum vanderplanki]|uniref:Uncharacterized protein n=1 Tax=Polypedilum vanderplanki TaxID=319348 RepID=A0A9J6BXL8_POLVA|nr:hypothetical protein PVAND_004403 [Polypedilum vanderplanki]
MATYCPLNALGTMAKCLCLCLLPSYLDFQAQRGFFLKICNYYCNSYLQDLAMDYDHNNLGVLFERHAQSVVPINRLATMAMSLFVVSDILPIRIKIPALPSLAKYCWT